MKINSGDYKYRNIEIPDGIRPTTEKVREAVFSMISGRIYDAAVLDLFAGSGVMGLEALSRGAASCHFNEMNVRNAAILKKNIANCGAVEKSRVTIKDFRKALADIDGGFDIVIVDPPYRSGYYDTVFGMLEDYGLVNENGIVIAEHLYDNQLSDNIGSFSRIKEKKYGTIGVDIYEYIPDSDF